MKRLSWKSLAPHLIAIGVFLVVSVIYCRTGLNSDMVLSQHDIQGAQGMSHQLVEQHEKTGHYPLWTTNMFSGMPSYQILIEGPRVPILQLTHLLQLWLPEPINFFFLACLGFYILCLCLGVRTWIGIIGSLAFAYCSFNPIMVAAGHNTQMLALAYAPAVLGGVILLFKRKYLWGFILTTLFTYLHISQNHQQVSYYLLIIIGLMTISHLVFAIREKNLLPLAKGLGLAAMAGIIGVLANAVILFPVYDYVKYSKRGGQLILNESRTTVNKTNDRNITTGLSKEYAFQWSYGISESMSLLYPGVNGYGTHIAQSDGEQYIFPELGSGSHVASFLTSTLNVPEQQAENLAMQLSTSLYWGDQPFTTGPVYLGAVVCFLFILSMFLIDHRYRWWILGGTVIGIMMAWGSHFPALNYFLFDYLPLYNKFRVPSMTMIIPQVLVPIGMVLGLERLTTAVSGKENLRQVLKKTFITAGALVLLGFMTYFSMDFSNENKRWTNAFNTLVSSGQTAGVQQQMDSINRAYPPQKDNMLYQNFFMQSNGNREVAAGILKSLREDRKALFLKSITSAIIFILLAAGLLLLFVRGSLKEPLFLVGIGALILIDLMIIAGKYMNRYNFESKDTYEQVTWPITSADQQILNDKDPNFRVLNAAGGDPYQESKTSYYHKSIGGYHPAKLGIYDDLITYQLSGSPNIQVLNMLNTKYLIQSNPQDRNQLIAIPNPSALGNAWFVQGVKYAEGPAGVMRALDQFNAADTAILENASQSMVTTFSAPDSGDLIRQVHFDNDSIRYESHAAGNRLAVFSEIYFPDWKAYLDGKQVPILNANYVLRALNIPAGDHTIEFRFEPAVFATSYKLSAVFGWLLTALVILAVVLVFWQPKFLSAQRD